MIESFLASHKLRSAFGWKIGLKSTFAFSFLLAGFAWAQVPLVRISTDTFSNSSSQHATEIEPDTFAFGSTIVAAFQVGRALHGASSDTGFATSIDGGKTWTSGFLPGISRAQDPSNPYDLANDPGVGYDAAHGVWLIVTMPWSYAPGDRPPAPIPGAIVSRSTDGIHWDDPIAVTPDVLSSDKPWVTCDNTPTSPFYGNCYVEWDVPNSGGLIQMNTSSDGGLTWGPTLSTPDNASGVGGLPLVQPNGKVIVPFVHLAQNSMLAFSSSDGGATWSTTVTISRISQRRAAGGFRTTAMPSAEIDAAGNVYVVWQDCRFRTACSSGDIVMSTSSDGVRWSNPVRIPIDSVSSTVDHFIPGLAVDPTTSGPAAHLALAYYYYPVANCTFDTCELNVGFISSSNGGRTWGSPLTLAGPMKLAWLPTTNRRPMLADYISSSYCLHKAYTVFPVAQPKVGTTFDVAMFTMANGLTASQNGPQFSSLGEVPLANVTFDYAGQEDEDVASGSDIFTIFPDLDFGNLGDPGQWGILNQQTSRSFSAF